MSDPAEEEVPAGTETPTPETPAAPEEPTEALTMEDLEARIEDAVEPLRERIATKEAELIATRAMLEDIRADRRAPEGPKAPTRAELTEKLRTDPVGTIEDIVQRMLEPRLTETETRVNRNNQTQQALAAEAQRAVADFELESNLEVRDRANEIYQGWLKKGVAFEGMVYAAASQAWTESVKSGRTKVGEVKAPAAAPRERARVPLRGLTPAGNRQPAEPAKDVRGEMAQEFGPDEMAVIDKVIKSSDGKLTHERYWKRFQDEKKADPLFGLK